MDTYPHIRPSVYLRHLDGPERAPPDKSVAGLKDDALPPDEPPAGSRRLRFDALFQLEQPATR